MKAQGLSKDEIIHQVWYLELSNWQTMKNKIQTKPHL